MPAMIKAKAVGAALDELGNPNAQEIATLINGKHGTKLTRQAVAHCLRYSVRNVEITRPKKHNEAHGNTYARKA